MRGGGGYVNDPLDNGGETKYGITKRVAEKNGYTGDMKDLPRQTAYKIYADQYWNSLRLDQVQEIVGASSEELVSELADTGVNMGVGRACRFLQRSLNVLNNREMNIPDLKVDGGMGGKTLEYLSAYIKGRGDEGAAVLCDMLNALQGAFYIELAERTGKDEKFLYGWFLNRVQFIKRKNKETPEEDKQISNTV